MITLKKFRLVSFDMFQTLVDVDDRRHQVWQRILRDSYSPQFAEEYWKEAGKLIAEHFNRFTHEGETFCTIKEIFEGCYKELLPRVKVDCEPSVAARILAGEHCFAPVYADVPAFFRAVKERYQTCLISDADSDMILPLLKVFEFDKVYISEDCKCYKSSPGSAIFREALEYFGVEPQEAIHIGDGYSDVMGASGAGMATCWLNRHGAVWKYEQKPDYTVSSLTEAADILDIRLSG